MTAIRVNLIELFPAYFPSIGGARWCKRRSHSSLAAHGRLAQEGVDQPSELRRNLVECTAVHTLAWNSNRTAPHIREYAGLEKLSTPYHPWGEAMNRNGQDGPRDYSRLVPHQFNNVVSSLGFI